MIQNYEKNIYKIESSPEYYNYFPLASLNVKLRLKSNRGSKK